MSDSIKGFAHFLYLTPTISQPHSIMMSPNTISRRIVFKASFRKRRDYLVVVHIQRITQLLQRAITFVTKFHVDKTHQHRRVLWEIRNLDLDYSLAT